jgi:hypothetical protein
VAIFIGREKRAQDPDAPIRIGATAPGAIKEGSPKPAALLWGWQFDGIRQYLYADVVPNLFRDSGWTFLIRQRSITATPGDSRVVFGLGNASSAWGLIQNSTNTASLGRNPADASTWTLPTVTGEVGESNEHRSFLLRQWVDGNQETRWDRYRVGTGKNSLTDSRAPAFPQITPTILGLAARLVGPNPADSSQHYACRIYEIVAWDYVIADGDVDAVLNAGVGVDLSPTRPAMWFRPEPGTFSVRNRGWAGGSLKAPAGVINLPLIVPDGPDAQGSPVATTGIPLLETIAADTDPGASNTVLQGLTHVTGTPRTGTNQSWGSGADNLGTGGSRHIHAYSGQGDDPFTGHQTSADVTADPDIIATGTVNHVGDIQHIPDDARIDPVYRDKLALPFLNGSGSDGIVALADPETLDIAAADIWDTVAIHASTNYGNDDSVCYFRREIPYGGLEEGLFVGSLRNLFLTDYHDTQTLLQDFNVDGSWGLPEGLSQLPLPDFLLVVIAFSIQPINLPNGIYLMDVWDPAVLRPVYRWAPALPPVGHYEGLELADHDADGYGVGIWTGESTDAKRWVCVGLENAVLASLFRPGSETVTEWATFDGALSTGDFSSVATQLHGVNGDYWYAALVKVTSGTLFSLHPTAGGGPWLRIRKNAGSSKAQYFLRNASFLAAADQDTAEDVFDDTIKIVVWETRDTGTHADLRSLVINNAVTYHGASSENRQGQGGNWPPDVADFSPATIELDGQVGWFGAGQGLPLSNAGGPDTILEMYRLHGRHGLTAAFAAAAAQNPKVAGVLDGVTPMDFGTLDLTDVTYTDPA